MILFSNLDSSLFKILMGNLLLLFCCIFYLAWWAVVFKPNHSGGSGGTFFITATIITGLTSIILISTGTIELAQDSQILTVKFILLGGIVIFIIQLAVTKLAFQRPLTSELLIIHIWGILELIMIDVLYSNGHFDFVSAISYLILIGISVVGSLICYVLYYRLNERNRYKIGMVPLSLAAICALVFLCCKFNDYMLI